MPVSWEDTSNSFMDSLGSPQQAQHLAFRSPEFLQQNIRKVEIIRDDKLQDACPLGGHQQLPQAFLESSQQTQHLAFTVSGFLE